MSKIKICGLKREEDIRFANELLPDFAGFVFALKKRLVSAEQAANLRSLLNPAVPAVGVFLDKEPDEVLRIADADTIQYIQLHGHEDAAYLDYIRERTDKPIIKAVSVKSTEDFVNAQKIDCDYLLFDNGIGGTGEQFDWNLFRNPDKPFFLAGGINPHNCREAITRFSPFCLDASSSVETEGFKDYYKMKALIETVRSL